MHGYVQIVKIGNNKKIFALDLIEYQLMLKKPLLPINNAKII